MNFFKILGIAFTLIISQTSYADDYTEKLKKLLEEKPSTARWFQHQRWDAAKIAAKQKFEEICKAQKIKDCKFIEFKQDFGKTLEKHGKQKEAVLAFKHIEKYRGFGEISESNCKRT